MEAPSVTSSDHLAHRRTEAAKEEPATMPAGDAMVERPSAPPGAAVAEVQNQIETWVDEGGAGDDVAP